MKKIIHNSNGFLLSRNMMKQITGGFLADEDLGGPCDGNNGGTCGVNYTVNGVAKRLRGCRKSVAQEIATIVGGTWCCESC
jgi:hypothetical protein